jgi:hypothetical protein
MAFSLEASSLLMNRASRWVGHPPGLENRADAVLVVIHIDQY